MCWFCTHFLSTPVICDTNDLYAHFLVGSVGRDLEGSMLEDRRRHCSFSFSCQLCLTACCRFSQLTQTQPHQAPLKIAALPAASLAKPISSRFRERLCLKGKVADLLSSVPGHAFACSHRGTGVHINQHNLYQLNFIISFRFLICIRG